MVRRWIARILCVALGHRYVVWRKSRLGTDRMILLHHCERCGWKRRWSA